MLARVEELKDLILVEFSREAKALSSTVYGGGLRKLTHVVFKRVSRNFNHPNPSNYAELVVRELGLPQETTAVFLTAVDIGRYRSIKELDAPVPAFSVITAGFDPIACLGINSRTTYAGTINVLILVDVPLSDAALVDLAAVASSAKTAALATLGLSCGPGTKAVCTVTDAVVAASLAGGEERPYAGLGTDVGRVAGDLVFKSIIELGLKSLSTDDLLTSALGMGFDDLVSTALELYLKAPVPNVDLGRVKELISDVLKDFLKDPNVWALVLAAEELDVRGASSCIPNLSKEEFVSDSARIVADEVLGISLSLYLNGFKALFAYYWVDKIKSSVGKLKSLPVFTDDVAGALLASVLSRVYDELLKK